MKKSETKIFQSNGLEVRVHAISTGQVAVKSKYRNTRWKGKFSQIRALVDKKFTEWMPIWVWVIEHPEGVFVIDTEENSDVVKKDYFEKLGWFFNWINRTQIRFEVPREEEIDVQLKELGIDIKAVKKVILTHLHLDHVDGLRHFQETEILIHRKEWDNPSVKLSKLYPAFFRPTLIDFSDPIEFFGKGKYLTRKKDLMMIPTPGHTLGHCSVILRTDSGTIFFAGDVCYYQDQLLKNQFAANISHKLSKATYKKILEFSEKEPTIFLPSHDLAAPLRLKNLFALG